jgi:hypothetical protein
MGHSGSVRFNIVNLYQYNQVLQFLTLNNAIKSFENILSRLTSNDQYH